MDTLPVKFSVRSPNPIPPHREFEWELAQDGTGITLKCRRNGGAGNHVLTIRPGEGIRLSTGCTQDYCGMPIEPMVNGYNTVKILPS